MLTIDEAKALVIKDLSTMSRPDMELVVVDKHTVVKPYGWVFFFDAREYLESDGQRGGIFGNGPIVVRHNKKLDRLTSAGRVTDIIGAFEKKHGLVKPPPSPYFPWRS